MIQTDRNESSTRYCVCGAAFTWSGVSDDLAAWTRLHDHHHPGRCRCCLAPWTYVSSDVCQPCFNLSDPGALRDAVVMLRAQVENLTNLVSGLTAQVSGLTRAIANFNP